MDGQPTPGEDFPIRVKMTVPPQFNIPESGPVFGGGTGRDQGNKAHGIIMKQRRKAWPEFSRWKRLKC